MNNILCNENKFAQDPKDKDKTAVIEKQLINVPQQMFDDLFIDKDSYGELRPIGSTIPRVYGLLKVHKNSAPFHPILDLTYSPYHAIAKRLNGILDSMRKGLSIYNVKYMFEFNEEHQPKSMLPLDAA